MNIFEVGHGFKRFQCISMLETHNWLTNMAILARHALCAFQNLKRTDRCQFTVQLPAKTCLQKVKSCTLKCSSLRRSAKRFLCRAQFFVNPSSPRPLVPRRDPRQRQDGQAFELGIRPNWRVRAIGGVKLQKSSELKAFRRRALGCWTVVSCGVQDSSCKAPGQRESTKPRGAKWRNTCLGLID